MERYDTSSDFLLFGGDWKYTASLTDMYHTSDISYAGEQ